MQVVGDEGEVLVLLLLADERLLGGERHDRQPDGLVNAVIDDPHGLAHDVEVMPFGHRDEGDAQEVVFRDDLASVQPVVKTLHPVDRRAAAGVFDGEHAGATNGQVAGDLRDHVG